MSTVISPGEQIHHHQTGPRTEAGKERSSSNATLHGGTSKKLIVAGETQADFDALLNSLLADYQPETLQTRIWVENAALAHWYLWRRQRAYNSIEAIAYSDEPSEAFWTDEQLKRLALVDRYKTQAERAMKRAQAALDSWKKIERAESDRSQRKSDWLAAHAVRERRIALQEQKLTLAQARQSNPPFRFAKSTVASTELNPGPAVHPIAYPPTTLADLAILPATA